MTKARALRATAATAALMLFVSTANATAADAGTGADDGIDIGHYSVNLTYRPDSDALSGVTTILGTATRALSGFDLHFLLDVSSVSVNNEPATVARNNGRLSITPKKPVGEGEDLVVVVRYRDNPDRHPGDIGDGWGWQRTPTGALAVESSAWWYPSAFDKADQATFDLVAVVPTGVEVVSNGALQYGGPLPVPGGDEWSWRGERPQPTAAALLAIGQYELKSTTAANGQPVTNAYSTDLGATNAPARASVERTPEIVDALSDWFGPYPFRAQGGLVDSSFYAVVSTATRPIYAGRAFEGGANASMVAHEIAHQWYANAVNSIDLQTSWLAEGFATYAEFLWAEREGLGTATELAQYYYDQHLANDRVWRQPPTNPDPDSNLAFPIYTRGALALQALRVKIGDEPFFRILRTWAAEQKPDTAATTAAFTELAERISGVDLDGLFHAWLYAPERPAAGPNGPVVAGRKAKPESYDVITANSERFASGHR
ncbi:M1 family aminopeptidase [Lentzea albidocapillata]|uniref:Peptidase family M1 n=1 Tax=Lentzea albidocapillata TaxID=40571 RepID=A0A1W2DGY0_9PSEU|nr:M1 family aminopeptidase [Lentzea albidocapillata]SMC96705.1 Peptidase family M1 [Lentzea albidocapillata]